MQRTDYEPAFPSEGGEFSGLHPHPGMSLRDYFAAKALTGMLAYSGRESASACYTFERAASDAYRFADAMLKAREQTDV